MLIDAEPLLSLCDRRQPSHTACRALLESARLPLITSWPCFTNAMYLASSLGGIAMQEHLWALVQRGILILHLHSDIEAKAMSALMTRYQHVPMDLTDASLLAAADTLNERTIFTLNGDFRAYHLADGGALTLLPQS
jgi:predicted nucleic acid-binding protein